MATNPAVVDTRPFHESGLANIRPHVLLLTPTPDGPLAAYGEKWGAHFNAGFHDPDGGITTSGFGDIWYSVFGNEDLGLLIRDFMWEAPGYFLFPPEFTNTNPDALFTYGMLADGFLIPVEFPGFQNSLTGGSPHWCNEWEDSDDTKQATCRDFVKNTTTLQSIEILQHCLGYMHTHEPRIQNHFDGDQNSLVRAYELNTNVENGEPNDLVGWLLHNPINMYTTYGESPLWGQVAGDWNGFTDHAGTLSAIRRAAARQEMAAAEKYLGDAVTAYHNHYANDEKAGKQVYMLLKTAARVHGLALNLYEDWEYEDVIESAKVVLSYTDQALEMMGEPDLYDPIMEMDQYGGASPVTVPGIGTVPKIFNYKMKMWEIQ
jgi:hypothetical protein